jgi:hypothetical protein
VELSKESSNWIPAFAGMTALFPNYDTASVRGRARVGGDLRSYFTASGFGEVEGIKEEKWWAIPQPE